MGNAATDQHCRDQRHGNDRTRPDVERLAQTRHPFAATGSQVRPEGSDVRRGDGARGLGQAFDGLFGANGQIVHRPDKGCHRAEHFR